MIVLWILLAVLLAILLCLLLLVLLGGVQVRIICKEKLRVVAGVWFLRFTLVSEEKKKKKKERKKPLSDCRDPEKALRLELKRREKERKKAEKKRLKAQKKAQKKAARKQRHAAGGKQTATPNLKEKLDMILALLKKLYERTQGKVKIRVRRMHIRVGTDDAAKTAITYGVILQSASYILNFIESKFTHIAHREGDISITPDYLSDHMSTDIDIALSIKIRHALRLGLAMLLAYTKESRAAKQKAMLRTLSATDEADTREK